MTTEHSRIIEGLLIELAKEEATLLKADAELRKARATFDVASRKYAAVRDLVTAEVGCSPYIRESVKWPQETWTVVKHEIRGRYRFIHMSPGDAAVTALKEVQKPLTLEEIIGRLTEGGIHTSGALLTRIINAALMRTSGIEKTEDGKYRYEEEGVDPADLPF